MRPVRALFFGTPTFAVPTLDALTEVADVVLAVTQPDRPAGRGQRLHKPAVRVRAEELGIQVAQPKSIRLPTVQQELSASRPDVAVVVAYGKLLPQPVLSMPRRGCLNVHASLLPRWRGAAPIAWAIDEGDATTGVTLMRMNEGLDTGPMLAQSQTAISASETAGELTDRLALLGAELIREKLPMYLDGQLAEVSQDDSMSTLAPLLKKSDGAVQWGRSAKQVHNRIRAMSPWPGAYTFIRGTTTRVKIHRAAIVSEHVESQTPGNVLGLEEERLLVASARGVVGLVELQLEGRKRVSARDFWSGAPHRDTLAFSANSVEQISSPGT